MPVDWKKGTVCPIYEKIDRNKCDSYRQVTHISCTYKALSSIISNKVNAGIRRGDAL